MSPKSVKYFQETKPSHFSLPAVSRSKRGSALLMTVLTVSLLMVIVLTFSVQVQMDMKAARNDAEMAQARANARLAVELAIAKLQETAGPDQRVTATADLLSSAPAGFERWAGVWDTSDYDPSSPDTRTFAGWLVSSPSSQPVSSLSAGGDTIEILDGRVDGTVVVPSVTVPKVVINTGEAKTNSYAYWVEDEGVKADLSWNEGDFDDAERAESARLSSTSGVDYEVFSGPFQGEVDYPIERSGSGNDWLERLDRATLPAEMPLVMNDAGDYEAWKKAMRIHTTLRSRTVMADVRNGGLRRDLSLAFEMDDDADISATERPTKFNQQVGEFVGGSDRLAAPDAALGMNGVRERFLYRDELGSGTPFSGDIQSADAVIRGPNWWALRDYANLYKRLEGGIGNYTLAARSYYPNVSAANNAAYHLGYMTGANSGIRTWDAEYSGHWAPPDRYLFRPARASYAPVLLGYTAVYSALAVNSDGVEADLALGIDPFFFIWNPYNRTLDVQEYAIRLTTFPGHITFWVSDGVGGVERYGPATVGQYIRNHANTWGTLTYLASGLQLAPGEVMVLSPGSPRAGNANEYHDAVFPGANTDNDSGAILTDIPVPTGVINVNNQEEIRWENVRLNLASNRVEFLLSMNYQITEGGIQLGSQGMMEHFWVDTHLPESGVNPNEMVDALRAGDHLQQIGGNVQGDINTIPEYFDPPRGGWRQALPPPTGSSQANQLINTKRFFGATCYLTKPAAHGGDHGNFTPSPVEVFSQFNPFPIAGYNDMHRPCHLSQVFSAIADVGDIDALLQRSGVAFPASLPNNGYWGESYEHGSSFIPMLNIPSSPLLSLAAFSHANITFSTHQPMRPIGNSWSTPFVSPDSPYGRLEGFPWMNPSGTAYDSSWLVNDALFDRYYLSGIAPDFTIDGSGYSTRGSLRETLESFFVGEDSRDAQMNPSLVPHYPEGITADEIVTALDPTSSGPTDGYKKLGAYTLIDGSFNVNSTSVKAWAAFLRANKDLSVGSDSGNGIPFPSSDSPVDAASSEPFWSGFSRISDNDIWDDNNSPGDESDDTGLAAEIVEQVKLRGPFMSLSDFVNHRVGNPSDSSTRYMGALQAAIEEAGINAPLQSAASGAGGDTPEYNAAFFPNSLPTGTRKTTTGIAGDITQADLLLPLAPRLSARSDTFRVRGYGEVKNASGDIISETVCEVVVQRVPEYVDSENNDPWDDNALTSSRAPTVINEALGRRFKVVSFRWLTPDEI